MEHMLVIKSQYHIKLSKFEELLCTCVFQEVIMDFATS